MAKHLSTIGFKVQISTRSKHRLTELESNNITPCIIDIDQLDDTISSFLDCDILIINITSKIRDSFINLISEIEQAPVKKVIFVSSTSVYTNTNKLVSEGDGAENQTSPLFQIENLFRNNSHFESTIVRFAGLIGYQRHPGRFFKAGKKIKQADSPANLIHRDDCIGIIQAIIEQKAWGETFNACADSHPTKREFYDHARRLLNLAMPDCHEYELQQYKIISNQKVKARLTYSFKYPDIMAIPFDGNS